MKDRNMKKIKVEALVQNLKNKKIDMLVRTIPYKGGKAYICYIGQLVDRQAISELVIRPLIQYCAGERKEIDAVFAVDSLLYADECIVSEDYNRAEFYILNGQSVIFFSNDTSYIIVNRKKVEKRDVSPPELMYSYRGPRDAFVEDLDTNLSLLRYRLKDGNIRIEKKQVGARTKSTVALVYLEDIVNPNVVNELNKRIDRINTDGIYETGELQSFLLNNKMSFFPQVGILERSDNAVEELLEGKVVILVDGSCIALHVPKVFAEFFYSCDDRYDNKFFGLFMRLIRYLAIFISLTATSYYVALAEFHPDVMPASYIVTFAQMRSRAPFSAFIAVLSLEFIVELMREALLRVPVKIGSAIAIVGAIIIGQAASSSGVYSPLLLILVSIAFLSSFAMPDYTLTNPFRLLKFFVIIITGFLGFYGFALALVAILAGLASVNTFGVPYLAPWAPFNFYDFVRTLIFARPMSPKRQQYMRNKDDIRGPKTDFHYKPEYGGKRKKGKKGREKAENERGIRGKK
jgi:spore germination protein KA